MGAGQEVTGQGEKGRALLVYVWLIGEDKLSFLVQHFWHYFWNAISVSFSIRKMLIWCSEIEVAILYDEWGKYENPEICSGLKRLGDNLAAAWSDRENGNTKRVELG